MSILLQASIALALSGILGWEREAAGKSAGFRTHMPVGLASTLFVVLAGLMVDHFQAYGERVRFDPIRIIEAVATGLSFLGAGSMLPMLDTKNLPEVLRQSPAGDQRAVRSFECAIHLLAPACSRCGCRIIGHGVEGDGAIYCCAHCARSSGVQGVVDNADKGEAGDHELAGTL